jgi:hypothetical protein
MELFIFITTPFAVPGNFEFPFPCNLVTISEAIPCHVLFRFGLATACLWVWKSSLSHHIELAHQFSQILLMRT